MNMRKKPTELELNRADEMISSSHPLALIARDRITNRNSRSEWAQALVRIMRKGV